MASDLPPWLVPKESPWDSISKAVQAGSMVAANRLRAQQIYVDAQQAQAKQDLAERQLVAQNEHLALQNKVIETKLANDAEDFATLKEWIPKFSHTSGDELEDLEVPQLHSIDQTMKVSQALAEKQRKSDLANLAQVIGRLGTKIATPEGEAEYWNAISPRTFGRMGGIEQLQIPINNAKQLLLKQQQAQSLVDFRNSQIQLGYDKLAEITEKDTTKAALGEKRAEAYVGHLKDIGEVQRARLELDKIKNESVTDYNSARVEELNARIENAGRRIKLGEINADLRKRALDLQEQRTLRKLSDVQLFRLSSDIEEQDRQATAEKWTPEQKKAKRKELFSLYEEAPAAAPAAPVATDKIMVIKDGKRFMLPASQLDEALKQGYQKAQ